MNKHQSMKEDTIGHIESALWLFGIGLGLAMGGAYLFGITFDYQGIIGLAGFALAFFVFMRSEGRDARASEASKQ